MQKMAAARQKRRDFRAAFPKKRRGKKDVPHCGQISQMPREKGRKLPEKRRKITHRTEQIRPVFLSAGMVQFIRKVSDSEQTQKEQF